VKLDARYEAAAIAAVKVMGLDVAGVDMLESKSGPKILEINSSPGLEGIERTSGVDVAGAIVRQAERVLLRRTKRRKKKGDAALEHERSARRLQNGAGRTRRAAHRA
jgi:ribosomal protein S6--L-glutamate ligase